MDEYLRLFTFNLDEGTLRVHCPYCEVLLTEAWYPPVLWMTMHDDVLGHWSECVANIAEGLEQIL